MTERRAVPPTDHVAIVVLNWNGARDTISCLESLLRLEHRPLSIVVCDNASRDDSIARIRTWAHERQERQGQTGQPGDFAFLDVSARPGDGMAARPLGGTISLLQTGANRGYAGGNNHGIRYALEDPSVSAVWVLNNDVVVDRQALTMALGRLRASAGVGLVGSTLCFQDDPDLVQCLGGGSFSRFKGSAKAIGLGRAVSEPIDGAAVEAELAFVSGAAALASRAFLEDVGLMREDYFLYWEELDWAARAKGRFALGYAPLSIVYHKVGASIGTRDFGERSALSEYYLLRNRLRFCWRFSKGSLPFVGLDILRQVANWLRRGRFDRARLLVNAALNIAPPKP